MNTKTNKQTPKIRKAVASVAVVGFGLTTLFTATAVAGPGGGPGSGPFEPITPPSPTELILEESLDLDLSEINIILDPSPEVETDPSDCGMINLLEVTVTNEDTAEFFRVDISKGTVEPSAEPVFEYGEVTHSVDTGLIGSDAPDSDTSENDFFGLSNMVKVEVYEISAPWIPEPWEKVVFDEELSLCDLRNELAIAEATADYEAEVAAEALAEAEAAAQAAEEAAAEAEAAAVAAAEEAAQAEAASEEAAAVAAAEAAAQAAQAAEEAAQAAIDQANAEREAAEAALSQAEAEKELALAQAEAEKAKAEAVLAQVQSAQETQGSEEVAESTSEVEGSDEELAVGEELGENGKSGMSGAILGLIIVLGLVGVAAITGAVLNLRKQR
ncbi:MAG: hypothetical protein P8L22_05765 [Acidimicrobiales bacterium]|nr:hypothetical protein [Acidimicrobiales bacterium]